MSVTGVLTINDFRQVGEVVLSRSVAPPFEMVGPKVVIDSREIAGGDIFIALQGERTDGHSYIGTVFEMGGSWAMVSRAWYEAEASPEPPAGKGFIVVADPVAGLQQLSILYRNTFAIPVIAIGGSNGKTTTKEMVSSVLATGFKVTMSQGNRNNHIGVPLTLLQIRSDTDVAVVELGINHPGEMGVLAAIVRPTHALLTNIGHEHLEFLLDIEGVASAEKELFDYIGDHGGTAFVNADDPRLQASGTALAEALFYGTSDRPGQHCRASRISVEQDGRLSFLVTSSTGVEQVTLNFTGKHNVINAVAAASIGLHFGLPLVRIREGLEALAPAPGWKRLEVMDVAGLRVLNDTYNANSDSMRLAIDALCDIPCAGRRVAVLGDMLELGAAGDVEHELIGRYLHKQTVDKLFTLGEKAQLICRENPDSCRGHFGSHATLLNALLGELRDGDTVLFKGSRGMKLERVVDALVKERIITRQK